MKELTKRRRNWVGPKLLGTAPTTSPSPGLQYPFPSLLALSLLLSCTGKDRSREDNVIVLHLRKKGRRNTRKAKVVSSSSKHLYVQVIDGTKKYALTLFGLPFASIIEVSLRI
ncbi:hypothetical protein SO802_022778 [Lithocarpus litseifolius]|uniref:Uncharacterized protein n=1 Tax=Lithocarpus litseifolius TaxID=425828 RepID=A0AAW2C9X1_9ROSI